MDNFLFIVHVISIAVLMISSIKRCLGLRQFYTDQALANSDLTSAVCTANLNVSIHSSVREFIVSALVL